MSYILFIKIEEYFSLNMQTLINYYVIVIGLLSSRLYKSLPFYAIVDKYLSLKQMLDTCNFCYNFVTS